jgi:hypothetical protein
MDVKGDFSEAKASAARAGGSCSPVKTDFPSQ